MKSKLLMIYFFRVAERKPLLLTEAEEAEEEGIVEAEEILQEVGEEEVIKILQ